MVAGSGDAAVANGRKVSTYDSGMCQMFVRSQCWQVPSLYGSAIEAWNGAREKHPGDRNPPMGAPVYYRGGNYGHAVIFVGSGDMRSTDCQTAYAVSDTDLSWPERAWGYEYLGWTGDINGVDLPLSSGGGGGGGGGEDDMPEYLHVSASAKSFKGDEWKWITWDKVIADSTGDSAVKGEGSVRIGGRRYVATLLVNVDVGGGERIMTRTSESAPDGRGGYEVVETNPPVEHLRTTGATRLNDTRLGSCGEDRRLRCEVNLPQDGTVSADLVVLFW
jgi:hypothetical protein